MLGAPVNTVVWHDMLGTEDLRIMTGLAQPDGEIPPAPERIAIEITDKQYDLIKGFEYHIRQAQHALKNAAICLQDMELKEMNPTVEEIKKTIGDLVMTEAVMDLVDF